MEITSLELFDKLKNIETNTWHTYSGNKLEIRINYQYYCYSDDTTRKYMNSTLWDKIGFNKSLDIKPTELLNTYSDSKEIKEKYKEQIQLNQEELKNMFIRHLENTKENILKLLEKRIKQVRSQDEKKSKNTKEKANKLEQFNKALTERGYQVSKVYKKNYYGYGEGKVSKRKEDDKYHKYIQKDSKNIKFATVEVKINQKDYKIGVKFETRGQTGCDFEEFEYVYNQLKIEKEKLESKLRLCDK